MRSLVGFPNPVNEKAARVVAACVALVSLTALLTGAQWLLVPLAIGFVLRVLSGPRLSPFGLLATRVVAPRLGAPKLVPGPPKRFAQAIGAACTTAGAVFALALGWEVAAGVVLAIMVTFATLESVLGLCVGCRLFALLMRAGVVPAEVCAECADLSLRAARA